MSAVVYRDFDLRRTAGRASKSRARRHRDGIIQRVFAAIERAFQRTAEAEAGQFIATHGGRLTDDVERQLEARFTGRSFLPSPQSGPFRPGTSLLS